MNTCVIGGGLMGMALADKLACDGASVTVVETSPQLGGLATWHDFGGFYWDRFYHVILPTDRHLIQFVSDIGLSKQLEWRRTYTGFYVDGAMHSISSNMEFLKFPLLSLTSKVRLALTMLYCARIDDWKRLESETAEAFLLRTSGKENYEKLWRPLLLAKLGENYKRVSAVFIWSYIKRLFSARDKSASAEHLGHVSGGYRMIFERLRERIVAAGGQIITGMRVNAIRPGQGDGLRVDFENHSCSFSKVVCTSPVSVLRQIAAPELLRVNRSGKQVEYLGVVCPVIVSEIPLVPFYVVNIADSEIPFTGMIGMSTVINTKNTSGLYLTYLPKYVLSTDPYLEKDDDEIMNEFLSGVGKILPQFDMQRVVSMHVNRAAKVQPLQVLGYSELVPQVRTNHPDFFVLNTAQFVSSTLNNNAVIGAVNRFYAEFQPTLMSRAA